MIDLIIYYIYHRGSNVGRFDSFRLSHSWPTK